MPVSEEVRDALAMNAGKSSGPVTRASGRAIFGTKILAATNDGIAYRDKHGTIHVIALDRLTDELVTISF